MTNDQVSKSQSNPNDQCPNPNGAGSPHLAPFDVVRQSSETWAILARSFLLFAGELDMKKRYAVCRLAANVWALAGHPHAAVADVVIIDSTRQLTASIEGGLGATGYSGDYTIPDIVISQSDPVSLPLAGVFSTSTQATIDYTYTAGGENYNGITDGYPVYWGSANASQNSLVSNTLLSGTGRYNGSSSITFPNTNTSIHTEGSRYVVDFYVTSPTPISLTGDAQSSVLRQQDGGPLAATIVSLTTNLSATPVYQESAIPYPGLAGEAPGFDVVDHPLSFQGWLEPGQTYTLSADAESTDLWGGIDDSTDQDYGSFSFTATLPEPTGVLLLPVAAALTGTGRRTLKRRARSVLTK